MLKSLLSIDNLLLILRLATPLMLVALSSTISELAGIISLGTEGLMLMGAFGAVFGSYISGSGTVGILTGMAFGAAAAGVFSLLCIRYRSNQTVCGVGLNLFSTGFTAAATYIVWQKEGASGQVAQLAPITVPLLNRIPGAGRFFTNQSPIIYITILLVILSWYVMKYTKVGLRFKAISMHPVAARSVGVPVLKYQYAALLISGALAGLGGGFLSIVQNSIFAKNMTAGRGFLGVAANIFGGWTPLGSAGASFIFAFAQSVRFNMLETNVPDQFVQMLPYGITIIALILFGKRSKAPDGLGKIQ
ncbi:MAG: ABC transporter permease [Spirochaetaceae bacterium]|jgi:simple sugar transport system permease protein|nr:ABC transporter permease [Spirochaetaceae bacterium]